MAQAKDMIPYPYNELYPREDDDLTALEWGSCDGCGQHQCCPICGADRVVSTEEGSVPGKHEPNCPVASILDKLRAL